MRRAVAIQLIINRELGLNKNENPWQGSFVIEELTDLVEEAVYAEFERLSERGGVLGAMETMYQRGKIQEESLYYERRKHDGALPIIGVNTFLAARRRRRRRRERIPLMRSTEDEKQEQIGGVRAFSAAHADARPAALERLQQVARGRRQRLRGADGDRQGCSLGQISAALYERGRRVPAQHVSAEALVTFRHLPGGDGRLRPDGGAALVDAAGVTHAPAGPAPASSASSRASPSCSATSASPGQLVGRTGFCIHPREVVASIPKVGGTKDVKVDRIRELRADARRRERRREQARDRRGARAFVPSVVVTHPLARSTTRRCTGSWGISGGRTSGEAVRVVRRGVRGDRRPGRAVADVLYLIWREPWMTVSRDTYIARTLGALRLADRPERDEERYPTVELPRDGAGVDLVLLRASLPLPRQDVPELEALCPRRAGVPRRRRDDVVVRGRAIAGIRSLAALARDLSRG